LPSKKLVKKKPQTMRGYLLFSKFTVHSAYSSSCRPVYDGVSPHWKEREKDRMCVVLAVRRGAGGVLWHWLTMRTTIQGTTALWHTGPPLSRRAPCNKCRATVRRPVCTPPLPSGPHQTCGSHDWMPGENSSGRAFPY
jgi:hypothetical protein